MTIHIVYSNESDRKFISLIDTKLPFFIDFIDMNKIDGRKKGFQLLNYWSAKKLPFVVVEDNELVKVFYSEIGELATNQLIKWLNDDCK